MKPSSRSINLRRRWRLAWRAGLLAVGLLALGTADPAEAGAYNPGRIIDDARFLKPSMDAPAVQNWLNTINSTCLKNFTSAVPLGNQTYGGEVSAATVIAEAARLHGINPQVLLATLQKEQGLVTRTDCPAWRYEAAMGAGCPDTAECNAQYKGFSKQVWEGGRYLRNCFYQDKPTWWCSYTPYTTGTVKFNPNSACGSTQVYISNRATATLYNYTPYQPNAAVLGGHADGCSAFGNLNFLYYMDYWFPDPSTTEFSLIKGASSPNQYLLQNMNGTLTLRLIPDPSIIVAWGLDKVTLQVVSDSVVSTTSRIYPDLTRLSRPSGGLTVYFMDNGERHAVGSAEMLAAWGLPTAAICDVSASIGLIPANGTALAYSLRSSDTSNAAIYLMDGGTRRQYQSPAVLTAIEGDNPAVTTISAAYLASFPAGGLLTHPRLSNSAKEYLAIAGHKYELDSFRDSLYPWTAQAVSTATKDRLVGQSVAPVFVRGASDPDVQMVDAGQKHHAVNAGILAGWLTGGHGVMVVPSGFVSLLPAGTAVTSYLADRGGQLYVMDGSKRAVPSALDSAYRTGQTVFPISADFLSNLSLDAAATGFIRSSASPDIFLLDNSAVRRHINYPRRWNLWDGDLSHVTTYSPAVVALYGGAGQASPYVTDGTTEYVMEGGTKLPVSAGVKADWGLGTPLTLSSATLSRFATGSALTSSARTNNAAPYSLIRGGASYVTHDANLADTWGIWGAPNHSPDLTAEFTEIRMLTRFVSSNQPGDGRIFAANGGTLYHLSPSNLLNLGYQNGEPRAQVNPAMTGFTVAPWSYPVVKDSSGRHYVIDAGTKRYFPSTVVQDFWTGSGSLTVPALSNGFLNLLPNGGHIERAIKGSEPAVYAAPGGQKRWIQSPGTFNSSYAPFAVVSNQLLADLPTGSPIP